MIQLWAASGSPAAPSPSVHNGSRARGRSGQLHARTAPPRMARLYGWAHAHCRYRRSSSDDKYSTVKRLMVGRLLRAGPDLIGFRLSRYRNQQGRYNDEHCLGNRASCRPSSRDARSTRVRGTPTAREHIATPLLEPCTTTSSDACRSSSRLRRKAKWHCLYTPPPPRPSSSGSSLITASSSPAKISRPSLMLATGITFSVHPPAL
jgi:hypothetical protein